MQVYLVDDDDAHCEALVRQLQDTATSVCRFADVEGLLAVDRRQGPACAILELHTRAGSGLALQAAVQERLPHVPVIFLTGHGNVHACAAAMRRGALDFLEKPVGTSQLRDAVARAEAVSQRRWEQQLGAIRTRERLSSLTPREREVLTHVAAGRLNKQIAGILSTEESTVKVHRSRLMRKLGARSLVELIQLGTHVPER